MTKTTDLLVEIGCEELPPKALAGLAERFESELAAKLVVEQALGTERTRTARHYGPRRLAVIISDLAVQQSERTLERLGPAVSAAYDKEGKPTKAAEGFARSCGVPLEKIGEKDGKLHFRAVVPGRPARELVPDAVRAALDALPIPKRMRWGGGDTQFVRPVQWAVLLLGDEPIAADIYGVKSDRATRGHRFHQPEPLELKQPGEYVARLRAAKVLVNDAGHAVEKEILRQAETKARIAGGTLLPHVANGGALVSEVAALCEWPVVLEGKFDAKFLALPREVLISTIEGNQRYFLLQGADGKLLPKFLFVANLESKNPAEVVRGNERVIVPRLSDAMFFWDQDRKTKLDTRVQGLEGVVFQKELGTYAEKSKRVAALAERIAKDIGGDPALARRAAELAKCDLLTHLVGEFPELQGTVGKYLAQHDGEPAEVTSAIEEQYLPRHAGDALPKTKTGQALALADKLDTSVNAFCAGLKPTGEKDPFALRRQALGVLRVILECGLDLDLHSLILAARENFPHFLVSTPTPTGQPHSVFVAEKVQQRTQAVQADVAEVYLFFMDRLRAYYDEVGIRTDVFNAVVTQRPSKPLDFDARLRAVNAFLTLPEATSLAAANKRIANILRQAGGAPEGKVDAALLKEPAERALYDALESGEIAWVESLLASRSYESALKKLAALKAPVDAFFDGVMVMAEDAAVRTNRLKLLARVQSLFLHVADLGQLQVE
jgi:glycyl-tRNA synthetase beta chain